MNKSWNLLALVVVIGIAFGIEYLRYTTWMMMFSHPIPFWQWLLLK